MEQQVAVRDQAERLGRRCGPAEALVPIATYRNGTKPVHGWSNRDKAARDWWQT